MVDKRYCMSSYMAFRYIEDENKDFYEGMRHECIKAVPDEQRILVHTSDDIDREIGKQMDMFKGRKKGILLSGGMDSAIVASYLGGSHAYTFRFLGGEFQKEELARAEYYAKYYGLTLHYVDISWDTVISHLDEVMEKKNAPVHSIEPQILQAALQAKEDGVEMMFVGESSDLIFGGMDQLLAKDWTFEQFISLQNRRMFWLSRKACSICLRDTVRENMLIFCRLWTMCFQSNPPALTSMLLQLLTCRITTRTQN